MFISKPHTKDHRHTLTNRLLFTGEAGSGHGSWVQVELLLSETNVLLAGKGGGREKGAVSYMGSNTIYYSSITSPRLLIAG